MLTKAYGMLPLTTSINTIFCICLASLLLVVLDASPVRNFGKNDVESRILDAINRELQRKLADYDTAEMYDSKFNRNPVSHIWKDDDNEELERHRMKRLGIAGHENMDMMMTSLSKNRMGNGLSIGGNLGDIQSMLNRMRQRMGQNG